MFGKMQNGGDGSLTYIPRPQPRPVRPAPSPNKPLILQPYPQSQHPPPLARRVFIDHFNQIKAMVERLPQTGVLIAAFFGTEGFEGRVVLDGSCDMSETFIGAITEHCPNAKLVLDRFHLTKALSEAMDEVRKEEWRTATGAERKALKGIRWILFKHPSNRTPEDKRILGLLRRSNRRIHRASVLKDEFDLFWGYKAEWAARRFLKSWGTTALKSRLEPIRRFVSTLRKHTENIITFIPSRLTNATAEGLNRIIRIVKNRASGFRAVRAFIDLIYLTIGDVDIPAQIPARFRTI